MSYEEVKKQFPFATIKTVANSKKEITRYKKQGFKQVSDCIVDAWGYDLEHCYMVY